MVLEKIEVQGSFQDGISAAIQKAIDKMLELQVSTSETAKAFNRLNRAQKKNTTAATDATAATAKLVEANKALLEAATDQRGALHKIVIQTKKTGEATVKTGESINDTFSNEVRSRIQNALDTMVEFGATIDDVEAASLKLSKAQMSGTKGMAQQANVLRTLVDESENAEFALANMARATEIAALANIKLEDAGRQLGMAFRGETQVLQNFDKTAKAAASAIDDITDPALRAKAVMIALDQATKRQNSTLQKLANQFKMVGALAPNFVKALKFTAKAFVGLGAAITGVAVKSLKAYIDGSKKMRESNKKMKKSIKDLEFTLGAIVAQAIGLGDGFKTASGEVVNLTKTLHDNRVPIAQAIRDTAKAALLAAEAITMPIQGLALLFATVQDGFTELARAASKLAEGLLHVFVGFGKLKGKTIGLSAIELKNIKAAEAAIAQIQATSNRINVGARTTKLANSILDARKVMEKLNKLADTPVTPFKVEKRTEPKKKGGKGGPTELTGFEAALAMTEAYNESVDKAEKKTEQFRIALAQIGTSLGQTAQELITGLPQLDGLEDKLRQQIELTRLMQQGYKDAGSAITQFAKGGVALASNSVSMLFENLAAGQDVLANFGTFLLQAMGDLLGQMGQAFIMLGAGFDNIKTGIMSPGALIAIGVGMVALSGALKGFASRSQAGGSASSAGGGTAQALERFGQRLFDRGDADQGREMTINIEGRSMRGFMLDVAADGARRGSVPLTPRRV